MSHARPTDLDADVLVVGGGLAGLAAAATAARAGARTLLLDGHPLGGRARTDQVGAYTFNRGPRALYRGGAARRVLDQLDVPTDQGAAPPLRGVTGTRRGRIHLMPQGPITLLRTGLIPAGEKAAFARRLATLPRIDPTTFAGRSADEVVESVGLGPVGREVLRALIRLATYTAATDALDGPAAVAQAQLSLRSGVTYLDGGWHPLVDQLERSARAAGADVRTGSPVRTVEADGDGAAAVLDGGIRVRAGTVVLAPGGPDAAAGLLGRRPEGWGGLGRPAAAACLELGLRRPPATRFVLGVDEPTYLSTHAPPAGLAPDGHAVVHVMRYLRPDEDRPAAVVRNELRALARQAGVAEADVAEERFLARMVVTGGIPSAEGGGLAGRPGVEASGRAGVLLAGDWVGPEGLLADAALASGAEAGRRAAHRGARLAVA